MLVASHLHRSLCCFPAWLQCHRVRSVLPGISPWDSCWPHLICSLFFLSVPHENLIMPQPSQQNSCRSLPSILSLPVLLERLLAASPFLRSPHGKSRFILESYTERWHLSSSVTALPLSLIMISSLPAPEHLFLLICCHSPLNIISWSLVFTSLRFCPLMHHD